MKYLFIISLLIVCSNHYSGSEPSVTKSKIRIAPYYGEDQDIIMKGIMEAKSVLNKAEFYKKIENYIHKETNLNDFSYTIEHPKEIAKAIEEAELTIKVRGYKGGENTGTLAYVTSEHPNTIFINVDKVEGRSKESIAATIVHEIVHSVDRLEKDMKFGHGGNSSSGKTNSAPYAIGRIAEAMASDDKSKTSDDYPDRHIIETENIEESKVVYGSKKIDPQDSAVVEEYKSIVESRVRDVPKSPNKVKKAN